MKRRSGFTIIEIVVVIIIIALMIAAIIPYFVIRGKKRDAHSVRTDLVVLDQALQRYAKETGKATGTPVTFQDLKGYIDPKAELLKRNGKDILGRPYGPFAINRKPQVPMKTSNDLSQVADEDYWSPYQ